MIDPLSVAPAVLSTLVWLDVRVVTVGALWPGLVLSRVEGGLLGQFVEARPLPIVLSHDELHASHGTSCSAQYSFIAAAAHTVVTATGGFIRSGRRLPP